MAMKVHGLPMSTCTARVLLCLHEKSLEFELLPIDVLAGAHKRRPHLSLHPFGQFPAFEDGDVTLFESRAITRYVARKHKDAGIDLLRLDNLPESAIVDTWMEVESHLFNRPITAITSQIFINPIFLKKDPDAEVIENEMKKLEKVLDVYEERLSKCKYLAGDYYSMADLHHIPFLVYFMRTPKANAVTSRPHVNAWWNDISTRPATLRVSEDMHFKNN